MINIRKRGKVYQYQFEIAPIEGKRKQITKSGFKTKKEAEEAGIKAYNEYNQTGHSIAPARLGHKNINITYDIYVRVTTKMKSDVAEKFEKYVNGGE